MKQKCWKGLEFREGWALKAAVRVQICMLQYLPEGVRDGQGESVAEVQGTLAFNEQGEMEPVKVPEEKQSWEEKENLEGVAPELRKWCFQRKP